MDMQTITASEFRAKYFDILDRLERNEIGRLVVTKRGRPVAVLMPPESREDAIRNIHGFMRGSVIIPNGFDLTAPIFEQNFEAPDTRGL